jgi:succinoglycan biosynthesis transport protein ExoP
MPQFTGTKDLRSLLRVLWRWRFLFLAFLIAAPVAAYLVERGKPKVYKSSALVGVNSETVNTTVLGSSGSFSTTNVTAVAQLVTTRPVAHEAAKSMHPPGDPAQLVGEVSATGNPTTNFINITATDRSPVRAAQIANAFAQAITNNQRSSAINQINEAIAGLQAQLRRVGSARPGTPGAATRAQLQAQLNQFRAAKATQGSAAAILQSAVPATTPAGPHLRRTVELGVLIGLLLGLGAVALAENADRRLRSPEDLEGMANVPLLASIPPSAFSAKLDTGPADEEAFQMLRTALLYFNADRAHQSVVITSAGEKDGKTTVAIRLALSAARAGLRVVLLDADLRRAQVGVRLKIGARDGVGAVLAGDRSIDEVLIPYAVDDPGAGQLMVAPAGAPLPNPAALISSPEMPRLLRELESESDLVVIDTPAALMVSDPLPLLELASGVVLVARMNRSTREKVRRLKQIVSAAHGNLLGVVATGVSAGPGYGYYASKYHREARNGTARSANGKTAGVMAPTSRGQSSPEHAAFRETWEPSETSAGGTEH